jgi:MFS family permease
MANHLPKKTRWPQDARPQGLGQVLTPNVRVLGWASFLNDVASEMIFPLVPKFLESVLRSSNVAYLGLIEGLADSISSLLKLWSGSWSDRVGSRKGFIVIGYLLAAIARPLSGVVQVPWHLLATRATDRIGKGIRSAPRDALTVDSTDSKNLGWAFGFQRAMDHLGAVVGPGLASLLLWLWTDDLRWIFLSTIVPGALVVALVTLGLKEQPIKSQARPAPSLSLKPFGANFRVYLLAMLLFTLGNSSDSFLLVRANQLGVHEVWLPILWLVLHIVKSSGSVAAGGLVNRLGTRPMILFGWLIYALVYLGFGLATSAWQIWALFCIYGVYYAVTEPVEKVFVAHLAGPERKGLAYGWFNFSVGIGALPASLIFGLLYNQLGALVAFGFGAALALLAAIVLSFVRVPKEA